MAKPSPTHQDKTPGISGSGNVGNSAKPSEPDPRPISPFQPHRWARGDLMVGKRIPALGYCDLINASYDIGTGVATLLEIINSLNMDVEEGLDPYIDDYHKSHLLRLSIASLRLLSDKAETDADWVNDVAKNPSE
jgi:hypothetical protein